MEVLAPEFGIIVWVILLLLILILPLIALVHISNKTFTDIKFKIIWLLGIIIVPIIGSVFYFIFGTKQIVVKEENKFDFEADQL